MDRVQLVKFLRYRFSDSELCDLSTIAELDQFPIACTLSSFLRVFA